MVRAMLASLPKQLLKAAVRLSTQPLPKGSHITRYAMYQHLEGVFADHIFREPVSREPVGSADAGRPLRVLSISHSERLVKVFGAVRSSVVVEANYPEASILDLPFAADEFDLVVSDQVLEHVVGDPQRAIDETRRVLKPGGLALHTTCLIQPIHKDARSPADFWRFTPEALRWLCRSFGRVVEVGGWGSPYVWLAVGLGLRYEPVPHASWHPLHQLAMSNDPRWPIHTWVAAEK
jgi:SAM-dependent methyltransferase